MKKIFSVFIFLLFLFVGCFVSLNSNAVSKFKNERAQVNIINNTEFRTQNFGGVQSKEFKVDSNYLISNCQTNISQYLSSLFSGFVVSQKSIYSKNFVEYCFIENLYINIVKNNKVSYHAFVRAP